MSDWAVLESNKCWKWCYEILNQNQQSNDKCTMIKKMIRKRAKRMGTKNLESGVGVKWIKAKKTIANKVKKKPQPNKSWVGLQVGLNLVFGYRYKMRKDAGLYVCMTNFISTTFWEANVWMNLYRHCSYNEMWRNFDHFLMKKVTWCWLKVK